MQFRELSVAPISHHQELNPALWQDNVMRPDVRRKLLDIAQHFVDFLGVTLQVKDITVSGSNAGYNYSEYSDIDLHIVADVAGEQAELFAAKKNQYNFTYNITINGVPVELYVQSADQTHHSAGIYSVKNNEWISEPSSTAPKVTPREIKSKARNYAGQINQALRSDNLKKCKDTMEELYRLRKAGLEAGGEQSVENLAFKLLRARGQIDKLRKYIDRLQSAELSLGEQNED
jgi:predicted nucleotidyltransferase